MRTPTRVAGRFAAALLVGLSLGMASPAALSLPFLVGASMYDASSSGSAGLLGFRYSTNLNDASAAFPIDPIGDTPDVGAVGRGISFELAVGTNTFTFDRSFASARAFYGLQLFFNDTGTSFNPAQTSPAIIGDLVAAVAADSSSPFFVPAAGSSVPTYGSNVSPVSTATYGGATVFSLGQYDIRITDFDASHGSSLTGSFDITVTQRVASAPAPASFTLAGLGLILALRSRKRLA